MPCTEAQRKISMWKRRMKMWNAKWPWKTRDTWNTSMLGFQEAETKQNHGLHVKHVIHGILTKHGNHERILGRSGHVKQNSHTRRHNIFTSKVTTTCVIIRASCMPCTSIGACAERRSRCDVGVVGCTSGREEMRTPLSNTAVGYHHHTLQRIAFCSSRRHGH